MLIAVSSPHVNVYRTFTCLPHVHDTYATHLLHAHPLLTQGLPLHVHVTFATGSGGLGPDLLPPEAQCP